MPCRMYIYICSAFVFPKLGLKLYMLKLASTNDEFATNYEFKYIQKGQGSHVRELEGQSN